MADTTAQTKLTDYQGWQIRAARKLAETPLEGLPQLMGLKPDSDLDADLSLVYGMALGEARAHIKGLLDIITELTGGAQ